MSQPFVIMDVGDVLVHTVPMAHYRQLACHVGQDWRAVAAAIEASGIVSRFETGQLTEATFAEALRAALGCPWLADDDVQRAWQAVIGPADSAVGAVAADLARAGQLMLASNTNPFHWSVVQSRLAELGISSPAFLSFEIGSAKPAQAFFDSLIRAGLRGAREAVFVDDRMDNVAAARRCGWAGWLHRDAKETVRHLAHLVH
jgi:FMN phosphatase YigB (HAD superfamily)